MLCIRPNQDTFMAVFMWHIHSNLCVSVCLYDCRIASLSKIFPTIMLYKLWEDGLLDSLDDPLEKYAVNFTIKNPLGKSGPAAPVPFKNLNSQTPALSLRRMASQLSGKKSLSHCPKPLSVPQCHSAQ